MTATSPRPWLDTRDDVYDGGMAEVVRSLRERNRQLEHALESRVVIEQAKGILAERFAVGTDEAFELIRAAARRERMKLQALAVEIVATRQTPAAIDAPFRG